MSTFKLTEKQENKFIEFDIEGPYPLVQADLTRPFVYERNYGVFYVPFGMHQAAMSLFLALQHGCNSGIEVSEKLGLDYYSNCAADYWLENTPGAAFKSGCSDKVFVGSVESMTFQEKRLFKNISPIFENF